MPSQIYEVVAQGARYWFLFLMVLIAWRSWRWYRRDKRQMKKRLRLLPDAGYVGEMVVMNDGGPLKRGAVFPVPWEGTLGALRTNDICLPFPGVARKHLWFRFDEGVGLRVEPFGKNLADVDGTDATRRQPLYMAHGSYLLVGDVELRLRLFAGFESVGRARYVSAHDAQPQPDQTAPAEDENARMMQQMLLQQQWLMQQYAMQQAAQQQAAAQQAAIQPQQAQPAQPEPRPVRDDSIFMRPAGESAPELPRQEEDFAPAPAEREPEPPDSLPPIPDTADQPEEDTDWPYAPNPWADDEDMTDAAASLPRSAYVGHDEAAEAKRKFWDRYFGGGQ